MADVIAVGVSVVMILCQVVILVLASLALAGGTWIENVEHDGDYFTRIQSMQNAQAFDMQGELHSMGMWRYFSRPGNSNPLPIRDPELTAGTCCYIGSLLMGCLCTVLLSYTILGVRPNSLALTLTMFWSCFFEFVLLLAANTIVLHYFKQTFEYDSLGHSHHIAWVAFSFCCLCVLLAVVRVYLSAVSDENSPAAEYRSPGSAYHKYQGSYSGGNGTHMRPASPASKSMTSQMMAPYQRDSYGHPGGHDTYDMRPLPPKNYVPSYT